MENEVILAGIAGLGVGMTIGMMLGSWYVTKISLSKINTPYGPLVSGPVSEMSDTAGMEKDDHEDDTESQE